MQAERGMYRPGAPEEGAEALRRAHDSEETEGVEEDMEDMEEEVAIEPPPPVEVVDYKRMPRRKATQRPVGNDQKRQAFSKRKRGMVQKAYQLHKLTDAKVFVFIANEKGSTWAYATPGFAATLNPDHLQEMVEFTAMTTATRRPTEVRPVAIDRLAAPCVQASPVMW